MWHTGGGGGDDGNSLGGTTNGGREGRRCVGAAVRAACWGVASQLTVTGGGRGDGVTMATVSAAKAKAMAMAQVGVVQMVVAGCLLSLPSHYFSILAHEPTLFGNRQKEYKPLHGSRRAVCAHHVIRYVQCGINVAKVTPL
jgi:hypothetical protein